MVRVGEKRRVMVGGKAEGALFALRPVAVLPNSLHGIPQSALGHAAAEVYGLPSPKTATLVSPRGGGEGDRQQQLGWLLELRG